MAIWDRSTVRSKVVLLYSENMPCKTFPVYIISSDEMSYFGPQNHIAY